MKKADRQKVFDKFGGKCAYCGEALQKGWHVDELLPCRREYRYDVSTRKTIFTGYTHPERLHIDNQMPACASCNINKHSLSLDEFRDLIENFPRTLAKSSVQYKFAIRYGLVVETEKKKVKFYFETIETNPLP